jgi:hypothetical protein
MPTARSANEREVSSRLCATRQGDFHQYWYQPINPVRISKHPLTQALQGLNPRLQNLRHDFWHHDF